MLTAKSRSALGMAQMRVPAAAKCRALSNLPAAGRVPWHAAKPFSTCPLPGLSAAPSRRVNPHPTSAPAPAPRQHVAPLAAASAAAEQPAAGVNWKLPVYIVLWYAFNIVFNIVNKSGLNIFPCPWFIATLQLAASGAFMVALWVLRLQPVPSLPWGKFLPGLMLVSLFHTIGHVSACLSFSQVAVSFTHIIKSAEPVFSVILSYPLLGQLYPWYVWLSLVPIMAGCSLSALKEVSFTWAGFNNAMISNLGMVLRNIYSKKVLNNYKIDGINLFALLSISSLVYCIPLALIFERHMWPSAWEAAVVSAGGLPQFLQILAVGGLFYHLYNQASYMVLDQGISPVTFSVGNTMKRVVVVVSSVLFFQNPVSFLNWVGSGVAILGTYLYTAASDKFAAEKKAAAAAAGK